MSISSSQMVFRKPDTVSDSASNGGVMTFNQIVSGVKNNLWNDIFESERLAGSTKYRKMFMQVNNNEANGDNVGLDLVAPRLFIETRTPGDDTVTIFLGTQSDTQSAISGSEDKFGMGTLVNTVSDGVSQIVVNVEDIGGSEAILFRDGEKIRISDKTSISDSGNNEEYHTITGTPTVLANEVTIDIVGSLANGYAAGAKVSSVIEPGDVQAAISGYSLTSTSGTHSDAGIATDQTGTVQDTWTVTFTSATAFDVVGAATGSVGSGTVGSDFSPTNNDTGGNYFRLLSTEWGGTFAPAETVVFTTSPAAIPIWVRRDVPAGATTLTANSVIIACDGESA